MSERRTLVVVLIAIGLAVVVYGFNFGRKPRPNTNDDITGVAISSMFGSALIGVGLGLRSQSPKLTAMLAVAFALAYFPLVSAVVWAYIIVYSIWRTAFG